MIMFVIFVSGYIFYFLLCSYDRICLLSLTIFHFFSFAFYTKQSRFIDFIVFPRNLSMEDRSTIGHA
jgi:hypothetical protein